MRAILGGNAPPVGVSPEGAARRVQSAPPGFAMRPALVLIVLDLCCAISPCRAADVLSADSLAIQPGSLRLGVERLRMPAGEEPLALAELAALTDLPWRLYAGPALLGAIAGERGGFFVGGIEGGWRLESRAGPGVDVGILAGAAGAARPPSGAG